MITQDQLKAMFHYNPQTGVFTRLTRPNNRVRIGEEAGYIHRCTKNLAYRRIEINGKEYGAHRLAFVYMTGELPDSHIDHIDGNGLNNAWHNLREATAIENMRNRTMNVNNISGCSGVSWYSRGEVWRAAISTDAGKKHIGYFSNLDDAINARKQAEIALGYHENHGRQAA